MPHNGEWGRAQISFPSLISPFIQHRVGSENCLYWMYKIQLNFRELPHKHCKNEAQTGGVKGPVLLDP